MKLEHQVTSLELSKKLKELGVKQESLYHWILQYDGEWKLAGEIFTKHTQSCSAFTVAELGEMLPNKIWVSVSGKLSQWTLGNSYFGRLNEIRYWGTKPYVGGNEDLVVIKDKSEANARCLMLIYLIENNLVEVKNVLKGE